MSHELFARVWYVGLAATPLLLLLVGWLCRGGAHPARRHALAIGSLAGLSLSLSIPIQPDPGPLLTAARSDFKARGLAPCRAAPPQPDAANGCLTWRFAGPWSIGCALLSVWHLLGLGAARRLRRRAAPAPSWVACEVDATARLLGVRAPAVRWLESPGGPMVTGLRRPTLLLPERPWRALSREQRAAVLLHELAHVRRRDLWTSTLSHVARALFWWHPIVWWLRARALRAAEYACDLRALGACPAAAPALAQALLEVERAAGGPKARFLAAPLALHALSPAARDLGVRLRLILTAGDAVRRGGAFARTFAVGGFAAAVACGWAAVQIALG